MTQPAVMQWMALAAALVASVTHAQPVESGRSFLASGQYLANGGYLLSANRAFFAIMQDDGNFVVYKGSGYNEMYGALFDTGKVGHGRYRAIQQADGNFCVNPEEGRALWCHNGPGIPAAGDFFTVLQDDGNLCTYRGSSPAENKGRVWCSMRTSPVTWLGGKYIVLAGGEYAGSAILYGPSQPGRSDNQMRLERGREASRWVFTADGTVRLASDSLRCWYLTDNDYVLLRPCDGSAGTARWSYQPSDRTIRHTASPEGCLKQTRDGAGQTHAGWERECAVNSPNASEQGRHADRWDLK